MSPGGRGRRKELPHKVFPTLPASLNSQGRAGTSLPEHGTFATTVTVLIPNVVCTTSFSPTLPVVSLSPLPP